MNKSIVLNVCPCYQIILIVDDIILTSRIFPVDQLKKIGAVSLTESIRVNSTMSLVYSGTCCTNGCMKGFSTTNLLNYKRNKFTTNLSETGPRALA